MLAVVDELGERGREGSDGWEMRDEVEGILFGLRTEVPSDRGYACN